jgi:hypothetical protein
MTGRTVGVLMRRLALGLAVTMVTAGCLMASAQTESAMSLEDTARETAEETLEDPRLIGLWGVETPKEVTGEDQTLRIHLDDEPGDGNAAGWAFRFAGEEQTGIIVVGDEVGVVAELYETYDGDDRADERETLGWEVDSEEAAETLRANASWPTMTDAHALAWELEREDDRTVWSVEAREVNTSGPDEDYTGVVDAETGEIVAIDEDEARVYAAEPAEAERGGCERDRDSGQVTPQEKLETSTLLAEEGQASVSFDYSGAGPVELTLYQDRETVWQEEITAAGSDTYEATIEDAEQGIYTLEATTDAGSVSGNLELVTAWGDGGPCEDARGGHGGQGPVDDTPSWVHTDRTLGVAAIAR